MGIPIMHVPPYRMPALSVGNFGGIKKGQKRLDEGTNQEMLISDHSENN